MRNHEDNFYNKYGQTIFYHIFKIKNNEITTLALEHLYETDVTGENIYNFKPLCPRFNDSEDTQQKSLVNLI